MNSAGLWPFADAEAAAQWQSRHLRGETDDWPLDAGQTALRFARDFLGYADVDRVTSQDVQSTDARIGLGAPSQDGGEGTVAVLRLARPTGGPGEPWQVVRTEDTDLTVTDPPESAVVAGPLSVTGLITGVDESLSVQVCAVGSSGPLGSVQGLGAGGRQASWTARVDYTAAAPGQVLTLAVSTGGHVQRVERFAVRRLVQA